MIGTKECKNQKGHATVPVKSHNNDLKPGHNSCGGCNACHQMTRIHSAGGSPTWDGSGGGTQNPCATNFFQRNLGNSYLQSLATGHQTSGRAPTIQRKCACGGSCASCAGKDDEEIRIQPKLTIGPVNDVYEQEADRVARQVVRMPDAPIRKELGHLAAPITVTCKPDTAGPNTDADIQLGQSGGRSLSASTRKFMEPRFGVDFGRVRLHSDQNAYHTASRIQARALTYGKDIWLGRGESETDYDLLAHELTHVVQQTGASGAPKETAPVQQHCPAPASSSSIVVSRVAGQRVQLLCGDHPEESYYINNPSYCRDTADSGRLHPNHRCYREIPTGSGCPPGEHVCFTRDTGVCDPNESHVDSTAPSITKSDGNCEVSYLGWCSFLHGIFDVLPPMIAEGLTLSGRAQIENMRWFGSKI